MKKLIKRTLKHFDFDKVRRVMEFLQWEWFDVGVPTEEHLKLKAKHLLLTACEEALKYRQTHPEYVGPYTTSTGGFVVKAYLSKGGVVDCVHLAFYVSEWGEGE